MCVKLEYCYLFHQDPSVGVLSVYIYVHHTCAVSMQDRAPGTKATDGCERVLGIERGSSERTVSATNQHY